MYREKQNYSGDLGFVAAFVELSWPKKLGIGCLGLIAVWIGLGVMLGSGSGAGNSFGAGTTCNTSATGIETCKGQLGFEECLDIIRQKADELGIVPDNIVETANMRVVRFPASDGSVLVTCSPNGQIAVTRSPYSG